MIGKFVFTDGTIVENVLLKGGVYWVRNQGVGNAQQQHIRTNAPPPVAFLSLSGNSHRGGMGIVYPIGNTATKFFETPHCS